MFYIFVVKWKHGDEGQNWPLKVSRIIWTVYLIFLLSVKWLAHKVKSKTKTITLPIFTKTLKLNCRSTFIYLINLFLNEWHSSCNKRKQSKTFDKHLYMSSQLTQKFTSIWLKFCCFQFWRKVKHPSFMTLQLI